MQEIVLEQRNGNQPVTVNLVIRADIHSMTHGLLIGLKGRWNILPARNINLKVEAWLLNVVDGRVNNAESKER